MLDELKAAKGLELDPRGNLSGTADGPAVHQTNIPGVFAAGDMRNGQSLVVWVIREGRRYVRAVDEWLMGSMDLRQRGWRSAARTPRIPEKAAGRALSVCVQMRFRARERGPARAAYTLLSAVPSAADDLRPAEQESP